MPKAKKSYSLTGEHFYKFFQCPHWIWYDIYEDKGKKGNIPRLMELIFKDGLKHEAEVIKSRKFDEIKPESFKDLDEAFYATVELMKEGKNIYHGVVMHEHWVGIPDLLEARPMPKGKKSKLGDGNHYYVVYDIKSSRELKDQHKFQLVFYSLILEELQGYMPDEGYIINADGEEKSFAIDEFIDYFHFTRESIERILEGEKPAPFLKSGCKQSPWYTLCVEESKSCEDISLVYRLSQNDQRRFYDAGIKTVTDLANADLDNLQSHFLDWNFDKILRFYNQATVLKSGEPMFLKKPSFPEVKTEVYFDVETDPTEGIDYLLGVLTKKGNKTEYRPFWAEDKKDEKRIWEEFLKFIEELDDFVIYHYSSYEKQVFDRFSNAYGISRELEHKFKENALDLWRITIDAVILPLYFYGLKDVAQYLGFKWQSDDAGGAESVVWYNEWQETKGKAIKDKIVKYNEDDVRATLYIKEWLEMQKPRAVKEKLSLN
ncbi:MAG: TM0106 family RecB-like putative nuclease [Parcubacteria group bacterium]